MVFVHLRPPAFSRAATRILTSRAQHWVIRMPNFVKLDSKPFHPDTYAGPEEDDDAQQAESLREKSMSIKLKVENTVRWRWAKDESGQDVSDSLTTPRTFSVLA